MRPTSPKFSAYGAKGITVCARWQSFGAFLSDMGGRPANTTLDRIDNAKGYEPSNCRWATVTQQNRNRDFNVYVDLNGERVLLAEAAERLGIKYHTAYMRIRRGGSITTLG